MIILFELIYILIASKLQVSSQILEHNPKIKIFCFIGQLIFLCAYSCAEIIYLKAFRWLLQINRGPPLVNATGDLS